MKVEARKIKIGDVIDLGNGKTATVTGKVKKQVVIPAKTRKLISLSVDVRTDGPVPTVGFDTYAAFGEQKYSLVIEKSSLSTRAVSWLKGLLPWSKSE